MIRHPDFRTAFHSTNHRHNSLREVRGGGKEEETRGWLWHIDLSSRVAAWTCTRDRVEHRSTTDEDSSSSYHALSTSFDTKGLLTSTSCSTSAAAVGALSRFFVWARLLPQSQSSHPSAQYDEHRSTRSCRQTICAREVYPIQRICNISNHVWSVYRGRAPHATRRPHPRHRSSRDRPIHPCCAPEARRE